MEYRALAFFSKYYSKWFVANESEFLWENDKDFKVPHGRVLARLVKSNGLMYEEVKLEAGGDWAPQHVFRTVHFGKINRVIGDLVEWG